MSETPEVSRWLPSATNQPTDSIELCLVRSGKVYVFELTMRKNAEADAWSMALGSLCRAMDEWQRAASEGGGG